MRRNEPDDLKGLFGSAETQESKSGMTESQTSLDNGNARYKSNDFEFKIDNNTLSITDYTGTSDKLTIPDNIDGTAITSIDAGAFKDNPNISEVLIPDSVTEIGPSAFRNCKRLATVKIGSGLKTLRSYSFAGCVELSSIDLPESLNEIMKAAFKGCSRLKEIYLPEAVEVVNRSVFSNCTNLKSVGLSVTLKRIASEAFFNCISLDELYYFSQRGISTVRKTDKNLRENTLPVYIEYIGPRAFSGCDSLEMVRIPYKVRKIYQGTFKSCSSLKRVLFHNLVREIEADAFSHCRSLGSVKLPYNCKLTGDRVFDPDATIVAARGSQAAKYASLKGYRLDEIPRNQIAQSSHMIPGRNTDSHERFYTDEELQDTIARFEIRHPAYAEVAPRRTSGSITESQSRFTLRDGVYCRESQTADKARIMMVGDLMAGYRQQKAVFSGSDYDFNPNFDSVRELLTSSDLTIGNLETMVSPSVPLTHDAQYVDTRVHLNAPESYLSAVKLGGIDCVVGANNHAYDAGTRGVLETLDLENKYQLIHTGMYASKVDQRYVLFDIGGIKIGLVSYLDGARQLMKKANFTKVGRETLFPTFNEESVRKDVEEARSSGAEFILAYCHWGKEFTPEINSRQRNFASMVVEAGVDYILGSHSHCLQPYEILQSSSGKRVPCLWSAGNFSSDINQKPPISRDTLVLDLVLHRNEAGGVQIETEHYHPCRIIEAPIEDRTNYVVTPTQSSIDSATDTKLQRAQSRIEKVVGNDLAVFGSPSKFQNTFDGKQLTTIRESPEEDSESLEKYAPAWNKLRQLGMGTTSWSNAVIVAEALKLGIRVSRPSTKRGILLSDGGQKLLWAPGRATSLNAKLANKVAKYKDVASRLMRDSGVEAPENAVFQSDELVRAWAWAEPILPVVLKPQDGKQGTDVFVDISDQYDFNRAFTSIMSGSDSVLVEKYHEGVEHRCIVIDGKLIAVMARRPASVLGDGSSSIYNLVLKKNELRSGSNNPLSPAHHLIGTGEIETRSLAQQGLDWDSVVEADRRVYLRKTSNLKTGGDAIDATDEVSIEERLFMEKAAQAFPGLRVAGLDILLPRNGVGERPAVIEVNCAPGIAGPHFPWEGQRRDIAGAVLQAMFPRAGSRPD